MLKILSIFITIVLIVLFPPAVLAFISNNAVPGDLTYPVKRKLEDIILAVSSVNPTTKAYFQINKSDRRFQEAAVLIKRNTDSASSLNDLTVQVSLTIDDLKKITDNSQKKELAKQLSKSISEYDQTLANYQQEGADNQTQTQTNTSPPAFSSRPPEVNLNPSAKPSPLPPVFHSPAQVVKPPVSKPPDDQQRQIDEARKKLEEQQRQLEEIRRLIEAQKNQPDNIGEIIQPSPTSLESDTSITLDFNGLKNALSNINVDDLNALVP